MINLRTLEQLNQNASKLNTQIVEINSILDTVKEDIAGMVDISARMASVFTLYASMVAEIESFIYKS